MNISPNNDDFVNKNHNIPEKSNVNKIMHDAYIEYAKMVVTSRAIPSSLDGLKIVQRRIVYSMYINNMSYHNKHRKSSVVTGNVCGFLHPHGTEAVYGALVHLTQDFVCYHPLIDGQGNFGSHDDNPAAQRYTEARLSKLAGELFNKFNSHTIPMIPNYDESMFEPLYLPSSIPLLFANGAHGIAVGVSTKIPPHNIAELCRSVLAYLHNKDITIDEIMEKYMPGPDFPGGEYVSSKEAIRKIYETGKGQLILKAKYHLEGDNIVFTGVPFQTSKLAIIEKIKTMIEEKKLNECIWVRDETNKHGVRIVVKLTHEHHADIMINMILKYTSLKTEYSAICYALDENLDIKLYPLLTYIDEFIKLQHRILIQNAAYDCSKAKEKLHIQIGLITALSNIERVIEIIKTSKNKESAMKELLNNKHQWIINYEEVITILKLKSNITQFSQEQVNSILNIRLSSLVQMGVDDIANNIKQLLGEIQEYDKIVNNFEYRVTLIENDLLRIINTYNTKRKSEISNDYSDFNAKDFVISKNNLIMLTNEQYIKKIDLDEYNTQNRSGIGKQGGKEILMASLMANDRDIILLFTKNGYVYNLDCFKLPISSHNNRGRSIFQILPKLAEQNDSILYMQKIDEFSSHEYILFITDSGYVRKNYSKDFLNIRSNGKIYTKSNEKIISVILCNDSDYIIIATKQGKVNILSVSAFRAMQQHGSKGVIGCKLNSGDIVIKALAAKEDDMILSILNTGFGRISSCNEYKVYKNRGGKGISNISSKSKQNHSTIADIIVIDGATSTSKDDCTVLIMTETQQVIRIELGDIKESSRNTRGTKLLNNKDKICFSALIQNI